MNKNNANIAKIWMLICIFLMQVSISSNITCDGISICTGDALICNATEDCYINCYAENSCRETQITCPSGMHNCIIDVNGNRALYEANVNSSMTNGGNLMITTSGLNAMYGANIDCPPNGHCNITIPSGNGALSSATIRSNPLTQLLYVLVYSTYALRQANILCPNPIQTQQKNCIIHAFGSDSIEALKIISVYGSFNVLLKCSSDCWYTEYPTLSCTSYFTSLCEMRETAGIFECVDSTSICYGNNSALLDYTMVDHFILCLGTYSCKRQQQICDQKTCYIYCGGLYACIYATFQCPIEHDCIVIANGRYSMMHSNLINATSSNANLQIYGYGTMVLRFSTVHCPRNGISKCSISVSDGGYQMITGLKIYGNVNLTCKYRKSIEYDCYSALYTYLPQIYCDLDQSFCKLNLITGYNGFECIDSASLCYESHSPTDVPTLTPTDMTINPTRSPKITTSIPTSIPTISPSDVPTIRPSHIPTNIPSDYPSSSPTLSPTTSPSSFPTTYPTNTPSLSPTKNPTIVPSRSPTDHPTTHPTIVPTQSPSLSPSTVPTKSPTTPPSDAPSQSPTVYPTDNPTYSPSITPSFHPTYSPTLAPSATPTSAPSNPPSVAPTAAPSISPTACPDDNPVINSNDGQDIIYDNIELNILYDLMYMSDIDLNNSNVMKYENIGVRGNIWCNTNYTKNITCYIECYQEAGCFQSTIIPKNLHLSKLVVYCRSRISCAEINIKVTNCTIDDVLIICSAEQACDRMAIYFEHATINSFFLHCTASSSCVSVNVVMTEIISDNYFHMSVLCDAKYACHNVTLLAQQIQMAYFKVFCNKILACDSMEIVTTTSDQLLSLYCIHSFSCKLVSINLETMNLTGTHFSNTSIDCLKKSSCDNLWIQADDNVHIIFNIYRYSNNIKIIHKRPNNLNLICGNDKEHRFIRYDTMDLKSLAELHALGQQEYSSNHMPCENILVDCTKDNIFHQQCIFEYEVNQLNLAKFIKTRNKTSCYWLEMNQVFNVMCKGNCNNEMKLYFYDQSFSFDIAFDAADSNQSALFTICDTYFGNINNTDDSLNSIDAIFQNVLTTISAFNRFEIYSIFHPPFSILSDGRMYINCSNDFDSIQITTNVTIQSGIKTQEEFDQLFHIDSTFVIQSQQLISELFGSPVTFKRVVTEIIKFNEFPVEEYTLVVILIMAFAIVTVIYAYCAWRAKYIRNPMVIVMVIGQYDQNPQDSDFTDVTFLDLTGIEKDIEHMTQLFYQTLNYEILPIYSESITVYWTKNELISFLKTKASILNENIHKYDGLILTISGHGVEDHIITSDHKKIRKEHIHRFFSDNYPAVRNIPRMFIFDCCAGTKSRNPSNRDELEEKYDDDEIEEKQFIHNNVDNHSNTIKQKVIPWANGEKNPDSELIVINSANYGYESKLDKSIGSLFITKFSEKMKLNIDNHCNVKFLYQILDDIQEELQHIQLTVPVYNNKTRYIKFTKCRCNGCDCFNNTNHHQQHKMANSKSYQSVKNNDDIKEEESKKMDSFSRLNDNTENSVTYNIITIGDMSEGGINGNNSNDNSDDSTNDNMNIEGDETNYNNDSDDSILDEDIVTNGNIDPPGSN
eukprot:96962_1